MSKSSQKPIDQIICVRAARPDAKQAENCIKDHAAWF